MTLQPALRAIRTDSAQESIKMAKLDRIWKPPKEGRAHPGLPCLEQERRCRVLSWRRILAFVAVTFITRLIFYALDTEHVAAKTRLSDLSDLKTYLRGNTAEAVTPRANGNLASDLATDRAGPAISGNRKTVAVAGSAQRRHGAEAGNDNARDVLGGEEQRKLKEKPRKTEAVSPAIDVARSPQLEATLEHIINILPGEMMTRDLLRPIEGTGKEKLREMGLRTRSYREYFQTWEDLHLAMDGQGTTYIRDDVVQYLTNIGRSRQSMRQMPGTLSSMTAGQIIRAYETYRYFLSKFGQLLFPYTSPFFPDHLSLHMQFKSAGRGIVLTAGDDQAHFLMTTIYSFRQLGCTLPVEVMYLGDSDLSEDYRAGLEAIEGVVTRDVSQMVNDEGWKLAGWAIKAFAILFSSFREVIFIDADSAFFQNPAVLFEDTAYVKTGALFFRDRLMMPESKKRWVQQVLPKPFSSQVKQNRFWTGESAHMQESGVVVVDKWKHFIAMLLVTRMNGPDRDGNEDKGFIGVYDMVYGDKETFWLGWELSGDFSYSFHQGGAGTMGVVDEHYSRLDTSLAEDGADEDEDVRRAAGTDSNHAETEAKFSSTDTPENYTICSPQLLHLDRAGQPLWFNGWILDNKFADRTHRHFATFESYVVEPHGWDHEDEPWQLRQDNECCLTTFTRLKFGFTEQEKQVLDMIIQRAREVESSGLP